MTFQEQARAICDAIAAVVPFEYEARYERAVAAVVEHLQAAAFARRTLRRRRATMGTKQGRLKQVGDFLEDMDGPSARSLIMTICETISTNMDDEGRIGDARACLDEILDDLAVQVVDPTRLDLAPAAADDDPAIAANAHSDDGVYEVDFDAAPWFATSTDDQIRKLAACGWGGDYPADQVAQDLADRDPGLERLFDYLGRIADRKDKKDVCGFECHVVPDQALAWLRVHRPALAAELAENDPEEE